MFELLKLKLILNHVGYDTKWTGWKEFDVSAEEKYKATAYRSYSGSLIFSCLPDTADELATQIAIRMGYRLS